MKYPGILRTGLSRASALVLAVAAMLVTAAGASAQSFEGQYGNPAGPPGGGEASGGGGGAGEPSVVSAAGEKASGIVSGVLPDTGGITLFALVGVVLVIAGALTLLVRFRRQRG